MTYEQERAEFERAIAQAITAWSTVELALCNLFSVLMYGQEGNAAAIVVFYSLESFRVKLQAIDAVLSIRLTNDDKTRDRWRDLRERANRRAKRRNMIAHHERLVDENGPSGRRCSLIRPMLRQLATSGAPDPSEAMYLQQLQDAKEDFNSLARDLLALVGDIKKRGLGDAAFKGRA